MSQDNLNYLGGSIEEGEVATILGAITVANVLPGEYPTTAAPSSLPVTSLKDGGNIIVKIGDTVAARFCPNERAQGDEQTYTAAGSDQVKEILLDLGMIDGGDQGPVTEGDAVESPPRRTGFPYPNPAV
jgi:hypothetical protein